MPELKCACQDEFYLHCPSLVKKFAWFRMKILNNFHTLFRALWLVSLLVPALLAAQSKYAGESFSVGVGGRGLAMGSAFHTLATGPEALYWNPAGMARTVGAQPNSIAFMHSERFDGEVVYNFIGYTRRLSREAGPMTVGVGLIHLGVGDIPLVTRLEDPDRELGDDNRPVIDRYISKNDFAILAGFGRKFGKRNHFGANVKILHERYLDVTATGFGFDAGAVFGVRWFMPLLVSVSARDITTSFLAYSTGKREYIKPWISAGVALEEGFRLPGGRLIAAAEVSVPVERRRANYGSTSAYLMSLLHLGAEYSLYERMFLRTGLDERNLTFGAGLKVRELAVDYAWIGHRDLNQTHRVSLAYSF
jgi:hypothetical protein